MSFDLFFLSYNESAAENNWQILKSRFPYAKRLHGVKGIRKAHDTIAEQSESLFFFVIDGDNEIIPKFHFEITFEPQVDTLYVWRCQNPVNDLVYGYGGVKLYNKQLLKNNVSPPGIDIATTIAPKYQPIAELASITRFNTSKLEAWRSAFREAAKLQLNILKNETDMTSFERLEAWCQRGSERPFGSWCLNGAILGRNFAKTYYENEKKLAQLNDFDWLERLFASHYQ